MLMAELLVILVLFVFFLSMGRRKKKDDFEAVKDTASLRGYISATVGNTIFQALAIFLEIFPVGIGMIIFYHRTGDTAPMTYGTFFVGYMSICLIIARLIAAVSVPFWTKVSNYFRQDEVRLGRVCFQSGMRLVIALSMILCVGVASMASQVGALAGFTSPNLVKVVVQGSALIPFMALEFYFSSMLMRFKKHVLSIGLGIVTDILFVMVFSMMWSDEKVGLLALTYAGMIAVGVYAVLLGAFTQQMVGGKMYWLKTVILPVGLAVAVGILQALCVKFLGEHLESLYMVLAVGIVGFISYWCALVCLHNFNEEELSIMPFGNVIMSLGKMLGVY